MEIYFALICSENIILQKESLTVVHVRTDPGFSPPAWVGIPLSMTFISLIYSIYFCLEEVSQYLSV